VIIRYLAGFSQATGGTISSGGGYMVHTFTGDGTFATNPNFGIANYSVN
jgi:hypothetical protein